MSSKAILVFLILFSEKHEKTTKKYYGKQRERNHREHDFFLLL